jgi:hypothetical protein
MMGMLELLMARSTLQVGLRADASDRRVSAAGIVPAAGIGARDDCGQRDELCCPLTVPTSAVSACGWRSRQQTPATAQTNAAGISCRRRIGDCRRRVHADILFKRCVIPGARCSPRFDAWCTPPQSAKPADCGRGWWLRGSQGKANRRGTPVDHSLMVRSGTSCQGKFSYTWGLKGNGSTSGWRDS